MDLISRFYILALISGMMVSIPSFAADDAYLKMLNGEAEELELDQSNQLKQEEKKTPVKKNVLFGGELRSDEIPKGLLQDEFEAALQQNFYGTYVFFKKLDSTDKQTVYYRYNKADTSDVEVIRQNIMDLLTR